MGNERVAPRPDSYSPRGSSREKWTVTTDRASLNFHADEILNIFTHTPRPPFDVNQIPRLPVKPVNNKRGEALRRIDRPIGRFELYVFDTPGTIVIMLDPDFLIVFIMKYLFIPNRNIMTNNYVNYDDKKTGANLIAIENYTRIQCLWKLTIIFTLFYQTRGLRGSN